MIIDPSEQGTEEWLAARCGRPTASQFGNIITSTGMKSSSWKTYMYKLVAERLTGHGEPTYTNEWMQRGIEMEPQAIAHYEFLKDVKVDSVGLCFPNEKRECGFSPDGLIGKYGGLEIKCPSPGVHVSYLLGKRMPTKYRPQVYSSLYMSGRDYWDFMSYHPEMDPFIVRVTTTDDDYNVYADALETYLPAFIADLDHATKMLKETE